MYALRALYLLGILMDDLLHCCLRILYLSLIIFISFFFFSFMLLAMNDPSVYLMCYCVLITLMKIECSFAHLLSCFSLG